MQGVLLADKNRGPGKLLALGADVVLLGILEVVLQVEAASVMIDALARHADEDRGLGNLDGRVAIKSALRYVLELLGDRLCEEQPRECDDEDRDDEDRDDEDRDLEQHGRATRKLDKLRRQLA